MLLKWNGLLSQNCAVESPSPDLEKVVSHLLNQGILARLPSNSFGYQFASPSVGLVVTNVLRGRKEFLTAIARRKNKCVMERDLASGKMDLKKSILSVRFHLRDLQGRGELLVVDSKSNKKYCLT